MANLTSGAVEKAIIYCGGRYHRCEIYRRLTKSRREQEEKDTGKENRSGEISDGNKDPQIAGTGRKEKERLS